MSLTESSGIDRLHELEAEYELIAELGRGGTSVVYLAREKELNRDVAIKVVRSNQLDDAEAVARLAREAKLVALLRHPNIVPLLSTRHLSDGSLALVIQHVPGRTLKSAVRDAGPLPIPVVEHVLREIGSALDYAHRRHGIVHRDIKPENIYLDEECGRALLADFGIARPGESDSNLTLAGTALGTPAYMSPEQIDGITLDGRSDLYSLGLVAYEMLTGQQPWAGCNLYTIIYKQKHEQLPAITSFRSDVPAKLQQTIAGLLHKDRTARWSDAGEFLAQLPTASIVVPEITVPVRETAVEEVPVTEDTPTLRYQRDAVEGEAAPEPSTMEPEVPAVAAVLVTPPQAEPVADATPRAEPRPLHGRPRRRTPGRSYATPEPAAFTVAETAALVPAAAAATEIAPAARNTIATRVLTFAHITQPRSRLIAATTVVLVLGASATVVAMMGKQKDPDLRASDGTAVLSSAAGTMAANKPAPAPIDTTRPQAQDHERAVTAPPAEERTSAERTSAERTSEKTSDSPDTREEKPKREPEPVRPSASEVSKAVAKSTPPAVVPSVDPSVAAAREESARDFKLVNSDSGKSGDGTVQRTTENIEAAPVFTPYTVKPELKNRDAVQRALSRHYPRRLREAGIGGTVMVWALVDESGRVVKSQVKQASGIEVLDEAAVKVAEAMRFSPALNRDQKVRVWIELPLTFKAE